MGLTDQVPCLLSRFCKMEEREIVGTDEPFICQHGPIDESLPIGPPDEDDRNVAGFAGLEKGQGLEELVERAEPAGKTTSARARRRKCILRNAK